MLKLKPPCAYQGGKQKIASLIVDKLMSAVKEPFKAQYFDICCGSGAVTLELLSRGVKAEQITLCDAGVWGLFWREIGEGTYDTDKFLAYTEKVPRNKSEVQGYLQSLAERGTTDCEYVYPLLQAGAFGSKQVYISGNKWCNATFRSYWQPSDDCSRKSPVQPMHPSVGNLESRVLLIAANCKGLTCFNADIESSLAVIKERIEGYAENVLYIDPPYKGTVGYAATCDYISVLKELRGTFTANQLKLYYSEYEGTSEGIQLFVATNGGISGKKGRVREEWLNGFENSEKVL